MNENSPVNKFICLVYKGVAVQAFTFGWVRNSPVPALNVVHLKKIYVFLSSAQMSGGSDILTHPKANTCTAI